MSETAAVVRAARGVETSMREQLQKTIRDVKQVLRDAICSANQTHAPGPLSACLDKISKTDAVLRRACGDLVNAAQNLLQRLHVCSFRMRCIYTCTDTCLQMRCICTLITTIMKLTNSRHHCDYHNYNHAPPQPISETRAAAGTKDRGCQGQGRTCQCRS